MMTIGPWQQRTAVFVVSLVVIVVEITLMRELALRFWEHLAWLVISIALLGFGTSGTVLLLLQRFPRADTTSLQLTSLVGMALSFPLSLLSADIIDLDLVQMVWQPSQFWKLGALEAVLGIPFLFAGMFIGLALQDEPDRIPGHYGASFLGSGTGGMLVLPALHFFPPRILILVCSFFILAAALLFVKKKFRFAVWLFSCLLLTIMTLQFPHSSKISEDKDLPQVLAMPGSKKVIRHYSPKGLLEIVEAPAVHSAPGLALNYVKPIPDQLLITLDARIIGSLYNSRSYEDYRFMDYTTQALPFHMGRYAHVLIGDGMGTGHIGLALFHGVDTLTALTMDDSLGKLTIGDISSYTDNIYSTPNVSLTAATVRGFLQTEREYSLIVLPSIGPDLGGLSAVTADSLLTLETFRLAFARLENGGALSITTDVHSPPRESLRLLNMFIDIIEEHGDDPRRHIVMIRNWATITIVVSKSIVTNIQTAAIRTFCQKRGFDLIWLPDLEPFEVNRHHLLDVADYHIGAKALLGPQNSQFTSNYFYDLSSPDDNKPFFRHFSRWLMPDDLSRQLGKRSLAFIELGGLFLFGSLCQAFLLSFTLIILPLIPAGGILLVNKPEKFPVLGFFSAIGFGFMLLEMCLLQRLTVYFTHPVYAAATTLSGFLFFGGLGSTISSRIKEPFIHLHSWLGIAVVAAGFLVSLLLDIFLAATEGFILPGKMILAILLIGPLATLMGMIFPLGMKRVRRGLPQLIPWAWSINGFASVLATLCAPLMAIQWGFNFVTWTALGCYCLAALLSLKLPP